MMATPHMFAGAAIGKLTRRPWLAYPAAFASHFLLDYTPHLDSHALYGIPGGGPTVPEAAIGIADFVAGAVLIGWLVWQRADRRVILGGALCGIVIDLIELSPGLGPWFKAWPGTAWFSAWHHGIQHNVTPEQWLLGVGTQVAVIALALWVIRRGPGRSRPAVGPPTPRELCVPPETRAAPLRGTNAPRRPGRARVDVQNVGLGE